MRHVSIGQRVRVKAERLEAYQMPDLIYSIKTIFQRPGYKALWVTLGELEEPYNQLRATELISV